MLTDSWPWGRRCGQFTLQWHLTNRCPNRCLHCYDRSDREELTWPQALDALDQLQRFGRRRRVRIAVSLTGGDPLLYPHFWELYALLASRDVPVNILGNPIPPTAIHRLLSIRPPAYYQVSLEGLERHNDAMRGAGHYRKTLEFLADARAAGLETHAMLTLTRANLDQVLPLAATLRGLVHRFTFNRLAQTGQARDLAAPSREELASFLEAYLQARQTNPVLGVKDNLLNIPRHRRREPLFPGCTGFGCGAAFNFLAVLPDGQVHACRKFHSPVGNLLCEDLDAIYRSPAAQRYRRPPEPCRLCPIQKRCRGCAAVVQGQGGAPGTDRDPQCFMHLSASPSNTEPEPRAERDLA